MGAARVGEQVNTPHPRGAPRRSNSFAAAAPPSRWFAAESPSPQQGTDTQSLSHHRAGAQHMRQSELVFRLPPASQPLEADSPTNRGARNRQSAASLGGGWRPPS